MRFLIKFIVSSMENLFNTIIVAYSRFYFKTLPTFLMPLKIYDRGVLD